MLTDRMPTLIFPSILAAALFTLFAALDTPAKAVKTQPRQRVVKDTVDTLLSPGQDGVTYSEGGGGHKSERKVVVTETVVPQKTTTELKPAAKHSHPKRNKIGPRHSGPPRDTVLRDTTLILGTPGSPTGAESRGMPGEKPFPGTKK